MGKRKRLDDKGPNKVGTGKGRVTISALGQQFDVMIQTPTDVSKRSQLIYLKFLCLSSLSYERDMNM